MSGITKLASDEVAATLAQVGPTLRALSEENQSLKEKVAAFEWRDRVETIANKMEAKDLDPDTTRAEKIAALMERDDLAVVEQAIEMSAPQMKLASVSDHPGNPSDAASAFAAGLLGD
jgi:hypothetical protein